MVNDGTQNFRIKIIRIEGGHNGREQGVVNGPVPGCSTEEGLITMSSARQAAALRPPGSTLSA